MSKVFDVIQVGYGPVSQALALMLGRQGRSVAVCERWATRYPLPRAVCIDHELYRVLAANGVGKSLSRVTQAGPRYQWFNAEWKELLVIDWAAESISGGPEVNFCHQPTLESTLDAAVSKQPSVSTFLGWQAISIAQDELWCYVTLQNVEFGTLQQLRARYLIGCDGANSMVRSAIGGDREDRGFEADWLVIDAKLKEGITIEHLGIPAAGQYCNPLRPTTIVPAGVCGGQMFRRWEFMRLPGESAEELEREERVWELLKPWAGPSDIELVRHKVYNFRSLLATRWRKGRWLIAGDAAHVMPPFMGQGMCSGMRDAWNLSWKLGLILDGKARADLLDTYQQERFPHVSQLIDLSIFLGKMICVADPENAAQRDKAFFEGTAPTPPRFPHLTAGILAKAPDGSVAGGAGLLSPHGDARNGQHSGRFDDVIGLGFVLISRQGDPATQLTDEFLFATQQLGVRFVNLNDPFGQNYVEDRSGRFVHIMEEQAWDVMLVRPDFYIFGGESGAQCVHRLVASFLSELARVGVDTLPSCPGACPSGELV